MYIRIDDGQVKFATQIVRVNNSLETETDPEIEQEKVCFTQQETDAYITKLKKNFLADYTIESLSWKQNIIDLANSKIYNSRSEAIDDLSALFNESLDDAKKRKINELNETCNKTILAGFPSSALGVEHIYGSAFDDQMNLVGMLTTINHDQLDSTPIIKSVQWKTKDAGVLEHTIDEFVRVYNDGLWNKNQQIQKYWALKTQVEAAKTVDEIEAITW